MVKNQSDKTNDAGDIKVITRTDSLSLEFLEHFQHFYGLPSSKA